MKINSITTRLLVVLAGSFLLSAGTICLIADRQLKGLADRGAATEYRQKLTVACTILNRYHEQLQKSSDNNDSQVKALAVSAVGDLRPFGSARPEHLFVIDDHGRNLLDNAGPDDFTSETLEVMRRRPEGLFECTRGHSAHWVIYTQYKPWNWIVGYSLPLEAKYAEARRFRNDLAAVIGVITLGTICAFSLFTTRLIRPVTKLTAIARSLSRKRDYSIRAASGGDSEVRALIGAFNQMLDEVQIEINERKQAEEQAAIFKRFAENSSQGFGIASLDGRITYMNSSLIRMLDAKTLESVLGRPFADYYPAAFRQRIQDEVIPALMRGEKWVGELALLSNEGKNIPTLENFFIISDADGKPMFFGDLISDISGRKHAEEELRRHRDHLDQLVKERTRELESLVQQARYMAEEARTAERAKSQFLANMSHEIRTPMNAVIGFSDLLAEESLTTEQLKFVELIRGASHNLLEIINDILDFSKIEAGKLDLEMTDFPLGDLLTSVESMMRPMATRKGLRFEVLQCDVLPETIHSDPARMRQCLINLVSNAVKFTENGHVFVNISRDHTGYAPCIRFDIEDTGPGIENDKIDFIFDAFTQADGGTCRKYGGTGLGLTITRRLAGLLGGSVTVRSEVGVGSVFSLLIPDKTTAASYDKYEFVNDLAQSAPDAAAQPAEGKVLVAEDAPANQALIKALLERMGLDVTMVNDGAEAIRWASADKFDIIFMDMQMPNVNGYEATSRLRKMGLSTPIIAVTARAMKGDDVECLKVGCDDYLSKPINKDQLKKLVAKYLPAAMKK